MACIRLAMEYHFLKLLIYLQFQTDEFLKSIARSDNRKNLNFETNI